MQHFKTTREMRTKFHWKIIIAFIVTPILSLGLFSFIYKLALTSTNPPPSAVFVFMAIFGVLGIWLLLTLMLRAKRIELTENSIAITRLFTFKRFKYFPTDVKSYSIILRHENLFYDYEILQFKTKDNEIHSVISYEFKQFDNILNWIKRTNATKENFNMGNFLIKEYGLPFLIGVLTIAIVIIQLKMR